MQSNTHKIDGGGGGGGMTLLRLIGIGALVALVALFWATAGASAQRGPTVKASYEGWATGTTDLDVASNIRSSIFDIIDIAEGSSTAALNDHWSCPNLRCQYLHVTWRGIPAKPADGEDKFAGYDISLARHAPSSGADIGVSEVDFASTNVPIAMTVRVPDLDGNRHNPGSWYVPVPWPGERVTVLVHGDLYGANRVVKVPAASLSARADLSQTAVGATLVVNRVDNGNLPTVLAIWRRIEDVTHYEVEYTFRTRSANQRLTKVTRAVARNQISDKESGQGPQGHWHYQYSDLAPSWDQHPNSALLDRVQNAAFGDQGQVLDGEPVQWMGALTTLGKLLEGAEGWDQSAVTDTGITESLSRGRNMLGVRLRPMLACAAYDNRTSDLCSENSTLAGPLAVAGKQSRITYVRFRGADVDAWFTSIGYVIP